MNSWKKGVILLSLLFTAMAGKGCALFIAAGAGAAAGVGTAEYINGELKRAYSASMEKTWNAALASTEQSKMKVIEKSIDNLDQNRVIKGKTQEGKDFRISLEALAKDVTMVKVRIGIFGDEKYSKEVQETIAKNLKK
jgi:predicted transcriptional regulator